MTTTQNDLFEVKQKIPYPINDLRVNVPKDSSCDKLRHSQPYAIQNSETCSFNVPWQLPTMKYHNK